MPRTAWGDTRSTSDIRYEGDLDFVVADDEEIYYLINETNTIIPETNLTRDDVLPRRSMVGMDPRMGLDADEAASRVAVRHLGWSRERAEREVREFRDYVRRYKPKDMRETEPLKA